MSKFRGHYSADLEFLNVTIPPCQNSTVSICRGTSPVYCSFLGSCRYYRYTSMKACYTGWRHGLRPIDRWWHHGSVKVRVSMIVAYKVDRPSVHLNPPDVKAGMPRGHGRTMAVCILYSGAYSMYLPRRLRVRPPDVAMVKATDCFYTIAWGSCCLAVKVRARPHICTDLRDVIDFACFHHQLVIKIDGLNRLDARLLIGI